VKLLKVIEEKRFRRMGSLADRLVDIRLIAATHQDLEGLIQCGRFRSDLYYRLNALTLRIPPLRDRAEDVPLLAESLLESIARDLKRPTPRLSSSALASIRAYSWPGNIRELRNALERACLYARSEEILAEDFALPSRMREPEPLGSLADLTLDQRARDAIQREVELCDGNISEAARRLGIARSTVYQKLKTTQPQT
jgi:DNA-binding NtrC family response regulator